MIPKSPVKAKYRNIKTIVDGITFHSKREAKRYLELQILQRSGSITELELQPSFQISIGGVKICKYIGDFSYTDQMTDRRVIEDAKGMRTREYILKKKLMKAVHGIEIIEV